MSNCVPPKIISNTTLDMCPTLWKTLGQHKANNLGNKLHVPISILLAPVWHYKLDLSWSQFPHLHKGHNRHIWPFLHGPLSGSPYMSLPSCHPTPQRVYSSHIFVPVPLPSNCSPSFSWDFLNWNREEVLLSYRIHGRKTQESPAATTFC